MAQVQSVPDPAENLAKAEKAVAAAAATGASVVVFPEYFMSWKRGGHDRGDLLALAQQTDGDFVRSLATMAAKSAIWIVAGMIERAGDDVLPFNTIVILDHTGTLHGAYRKSHLFDAFRYKESDSFSRGDESFQTLDTPLGNTGVFVCYELRFPEVARGQALSGASVLIVPSAWVSGPLKDLHWETLLRARAIENGCYVIAAAQVGNEFCGQSLILDPMGVVVAQGSEQECLIQGEIDQARTDQVRGSVPSLEHRRPEMYRSH